jgi:hypothetical protein
MFHLEVFPGSLRGSYRAHIELTSPPQEADGFNYVGLEAR